MDEARRQGGLSHKLGLRAAGFGLAALFTSAAHAGWDAPSVTIMPDGTHRVSPSMRSMLRDSLSTYQPITSPSKGTRVTTPGAGPVGTGTVSMSASRTITAQNVARAISRGAAATGWGVVVTTAVGAAWCKFETGSLLCDERQDPTAVAYREWRIDVPQCPGSSYCGWYADAQSLASAYIPSLSSSTGGYVGGSYVSCTNSYTLHSYSAPPGQYVGSISLKRTGQIFNGSSCVAIPQNDPLITRNVVLRDASAPMLQCPAVPDFSDPRYNVPGGPADKDGKCPTGRYGGRSEDETSDRVGYYLPPGDVDDAARDAADKVGPAADALDQLAGIPEVTGPSSAPGPTRTTTSPGGVVTTQNTSYQITYLGDTYNYTITNTTTNSDGSPGTSETAPVEFKTCGLPGTPPCQIDDSRMVFQSPGMLDPAAEAARDAATRGALAGSVQAPPSTWDFSLLLPPLATCQPIDFAGLGSLDGCGMVETVRSVMAYVWALAAAWLCIGMFTKSVRGG